MQWKTTLESRLVHYTGIVYEHDTLIRNVDVLYTWRRYANVKFSNYVINCAVYWGLTLEITALKLKIALAFHSNTFNCKSCN